MSQCCNKFIFDDTPDTFQMWQGLRGPYFTPHVAENGDLSWSNNGQLQNPETVNIKGPPGPGGVPGGTTGQLLAKASDEDYDTEWIDPPDLDAGHVEYDPAETYDDGSVGKELTTINSALSSLSSVTEIIDTASGAIASFPDGSGLPMRSLLAQINPVQDLHGYANPWAGGSGKNKLPLPPAETKSGITLAHNADGSITLTGTATEITYFDFDTDFNSTLYAGYILSGYPSGYSGDTNSINFRICSASSRAAVQDYLSSGTGIIEDNGEHLRIALRVASNYAIPSGGLVFKPMLRASTDSDTFQPYSNVCPITGWTGLSGKRCGKNLLDDSIKSSASGGFVFFNTAGDRYHKTATLQAGTYTFSVTYSQAFETTKAHLNVYDVETDTRLAFAYNNTKVSFTLAKITDISLVVQNSGLTTSDILTAQIELGSTASTYEAYTSLPIAVSWQSEAGTVYGGTVDVVTGVLTVDTEVFVLDGSQSNFIVTAYTDYSGVRWRGYESVGIPNPKLWSDKFKSASPSGGALSAVWGGSSVVRMNFGLPATVTTATEAQAWFTANPTTVVASIASPQTYQLTPQQIETLLGNNTVFVDCGSVSVTYQASIKGYIDKVLGQ